MMRGVVVVRGAAGSGRPQCQQVEQKRHRWCGRPLASLTIISVVGYHPMPRRDAAPRRSPSPEETTAERARGGRPHDDLLHPNSPVSAVRGEPAPGRGQGRTGAACPLARSAGQPVLRVHLLAALDSCEPGARLRGEEDERVTAQHAHDACRHPGERLLRLRRHRPRRRHDGRG